MGALWEKKLLKKFTGHISHCWVGGNEGVAKTKLFCDPSLWLRIFIFNILDSHLSETRSPVGRVHICWKDQFFMFCTCFSVCSNTTVALLSWKTGIVKSDLRDNIRWELQHGTGDNVKELPWSVFFFNSLAFYSFNSNIVEHKKIHTLITGAFWSLDTQIRLSSFCFLFTKVI